MKYGIILVIAAIIVVAILLLRSKSPQMYEIAPGNELQEKYDLYAENRPEISIKSSDVPENLRHLIPLAEKWGVGDDIVRGDVIKKASDEDKAEIKAALEKDMPLVNRWLDSIGDGADMSDAAAAFMYMCAVPDEILVYEYMAEQGIEDR